MHHPNPFGYGRIISQNNKLIKIVEEKDASDSEKRIQLCNSGVIFAETEYLFKLLGKITKENAQNEYYLTDCFSLANDEGTPAYVFETDNYRSFDGVNNRAQLAAIEQTLNQQNIQKLSGDGVAFRLPQTIYIEDGVTIGADSVIGPGCCFYRGTEIGEGCNIGANTVLKGVKIAHGTSLPPNTSME